MYKTLVVVDDDSLIPHNLSLDIISFASYISEYPKLDEPRTRVINLCDTEHYLSRGYYCSLLAEARQHKVLPSVSTINDLRSREAEPADGDAPAMSPVFFGWSPDSAIQKLAKRAFQAYPSPILGVAPPPRSGADYRVCRLGFSSLNEEQRAQFVTQLVDFTEQVWRNPTHKRKLRWDMAILVNPDEPDPSDPVALKRFIKAAAKVGIEAETITAAQADQIPHYDALFIRETTAIDHHTYRIARLAEEEGLVVMDDSQSILRCCNKVFMHDAFSYRGVPSLRTRILTSAEESELDNVEQDFGYPLVLKMPEGSFSKGVFRVHNREELAVKAADLLRSTALLLAQEYCFTEYDWRIGVLGNKAIFACRYHMAKNHWQIYNHSAKRHHAGDAETMPTFEVPSVVISAAVRAAAIAGEGLYGVDIKQRGAEVFVIEVNDNPNIDRGVEDLYLGRELYSLIMSEFARRLEGHGLG